MLLADDARPQLDETDAADRLGIRPSLLRKMRQRERGPAFFKIGRSVRYDPADIAAYLGRRRVAPANEAEGPRRIAPQGSVSREAEDAG